MLKSVVAFVFLLPAMLFAADVAFGPSPISPPPVQREFRAAWITEVAANPDWPSQPNMTAEQQKAELAGLINNAARLHFNAVFFQVRPACDAFYASSLEPWSERITGFMGHAPSPYYDPLQFVIDECHKRGLQVHAWFNPYRAAHPSAKSPVAANHITKTHPEYIRYYGGNIWLDPGEPGAQQHTLNVVMDVVKRYDVDGVVFDDYFYPYPEKSGKRDLDFPDNETWLRYGVKSGLSRDDWRRANVDSLIERVSQSIKTMKPWVQFGVSPFGIWRPQNPQPVRGLDAYGKLYADSRKWLANGWVDYLAPQLYWSIASPEQGFSTLFQWWRAQNPKGRHVYVGLNDAAVPEKFSSDEITRQIQTIRSLTSSGGEVHYHLRTVIENPGLRSSVANLYSQPALIPSSSWINPTSPAPPNVSAYHDSDGTTVRWWQNAQGEPARWWVLQFHANGNWTMEIQPGNQSGRLIPIADVDAISVRAVSRAGNMSPPTVVVPRTYSSANTTRGFQQPPQK